MKPGAYQARAQATVQMRTASPSAFRNGLHVALALRAPAPEGGNVAEVDALGYARHPVSFEVSGGSGGRSRLLQSMADIIFENVSAWPQPTHLALVDADNSVVASGRLVTSAGHAPANTIKFAASAIELDLRTPSPDVKPAHQGRQRPPK